MGRPLNDKFFGDPSNPNDPNGQLRVQAWIPGGTGMVTAWIVNQKSNTTYTVTDGTNTGRCKLQADTITGAGQMRIVVSPFVGGTEYARILNAHHVKTFSGNVYAWDALESADEFNEADLDFA